MRVFIVALVAVVAVLIAGCHQSDVPLIMPQPGLPCGEVGVPCYDGNPPVFTHDCCPQDFICGGGFPNIGCPADSCCAEPTDGVKLNPDGMTHQFARIVHKTPE